MANGFEINIGESDFKSRAPAEQSWILFQGIEATRKCIQAIDREGCEFAKKQQRYGKLKMFSAISGGITFALGMVYIVYQMTCH